MHILRLLQAGSPGILRSMLLVTCLAGLSDVALIGIINQAAAQGARDEPFSAGSVLLYVFVFGVFYVANRSSLREANQYLQHCLDGLRRRVVDKIRRAPLRQLEQVGHGELYAALAQEIDQLSQTMPLFVSAVQSAFLLGFTLLYIAFLSLPAFLLLAGCTALGLLVFWRRRMKLNVRLAGVYAYEAAMLDGMQHFTEGFQEIRLHADKNDALFHRFAIIVDELCRAIVRVGRDWVVLLQFSNAFLYALLGVVVFVLPIFFTGFTDVIYKIAAAAIFCVGPVIGITSATHVYAKAEIGLAHVYRMEGLLDRTELIAPAAADPGRFHDFQRIVLDAVTFSYRDASGNIGFTFGPWTVTLERNELVFLVGGNGAGKSTAMKLLAGLYTPDSGRILVDGEPVTDATRQDYAELFSAIFPDFHLFDRLYGLDAADPARVHTLLERMDLTDKSGFADGRFSTTALSTGQRKRLAMIVSLLEDREIYLFDEWAADQDSRFRAVYYSEILPDLQRRGKTIVAVTHDERYWPACDRRLTIEQGMMQADEAGVGAPAAG